MPATLTRTLKEGMVGDDVRAVRRACLKFNGEPTSPLTTDQQRTFGPGMVLLVKRAQDQAVMSKTGVVGPKLMAALRRAGSFDLYGEKLLEDYAAANPKRKVPALGPVTPGGKTVLNHDLTHATAGIPGYPAFDDAFRQGLTVIAPEDLLVTGQSSANPGDAFYAKGLSTIKYWFGHLDRSPANGARIKKGTFIAKVAANSVGGGPHVHVGIDAKPLCGFELVHKTTYQHGAPTVGEQLRKWAKG